MNAIHRHLTVCAAESVRVARGVTDDRLAEGSRCTDWTVRELVNHLVRYGAHGLEHRALRLELPEELVLRDFAAEGDWAERYAEQLDRALAAWEKPEAWEGDVDMGGSPVPAAEIAAMLVLELALHGWDLARSTGQEYALPEETGAYVLEVVERYAEMYREYEGFDAPVATEPGDAGAASFARALALSGRGA
ncbi:TIGR03086 family metal-binding protein [Streptomyces sp. NPDC046275]|uniref:TIGR03086 family metal-binding protein n=1 Tax=Streptomyces sp. NPDC046275 TaxID=3157201 RepID=UPI0033D997BA